MKRKHQHEKMRSADVAVDDSDRVTKSCFHCDEVFVVPVEDADKRHLCWHCRGFLKSLADNIKHDVNQTHWRLYLAIRGGTESFETLDLYGIFMSALKCDGGEP